MAISPNLRRRVHEEVDRCLDTETVVCIELVKKNEHVVLSEFPKPRRLGARIRLELRDAPVKTKPKERRPVKRKGRG